MAGTVGAARGRKGLVAASAAFAAGLALGAAAVFGGLGLLGTSVGLPRAVLFAVVVLAVVVDAAALRVRPQVHFQVPERWRRTMPLPLALFLYGALLGTGVSTFVPAAALWALLPLSVGLGASALAIGLSFAAGRALPVIVLAARGDETGLAERPRGLRLLRLLAAASLLLALAAGAASAATTIAKPAGDPSVAGTDLAWMQPGVGGFLLRGDQRTQLPGKDPTLGDALIAWHSGDVVTVAASDTLTPVVQEAIPGVEKLAVSTKWLVYRAGYHDGTEQILYRSLANPTQSSTITRRRPAGELGRPVVSGDFVLFHYATAQASSLIFVNLANGRRRSLRHSRDSLLMNPSVSGTDLLYVRASRCSQQLRLAPTFGGRARVLYAIAPLAGQDLGHERGHTRQGEHLPCPYRPKPTTRMLWTTALSPTSAYVTVILPKRGGRTTPTLLAVSR
jgi:hypothetical protein